MRLMHAGPTLLIKPSIPQSIHTRLSDLLLGSAYRCHQTVTTGGVTPGSVFNKVGLDYTGPLQVKYGAVCKNYVCVFISLAVKAVHLEVVSELTTDAFIATLRRFIARRGYPSLIGATTGTVYCSGTSLGLPE